MVPGVREAKALSTLLKNHHIFKNFTIVNVAGDGDEEIDTTDALKAVNIPCVEVHISDVDNREPFRSISYVGMVAKKTIKGHGFAGYLEAIDYLLNNNNK